jgi:hypothetical protein
MLTAAFPLPGPDSKPKATGEGSPPVPLAPPLHQNHLVLGAADRPQTRPFSCFSAFGEVASVVPSGADAAPVFEEGFGRDAIHLGAEAVHVP